MSPRKLRAGYLVLEALNALATTFFFYYLFFFMARTHGFGNRENLALAAVNGLVYAVGAWLGGQFGQRFGYARALRLGFVIMALALTVGGLASAVTTHIAVMLVCTVGMCLTWPNLQALVSEKETLYGLQKVIGVYNMVWAAFNGIAFFAGGIVLESLEPRSLFWIPVVVQLAQLAILHKLQQHSTSVATREAGVSSEFSPAATLNPRPIAKAKAFLKMAWFINPFAYVAVNTTVAVIPGLARKLGLTPAATGFFCSIWMFARLAAFLGLWLWHDWHYRFRWLITAYLLLIAGFATILLVPNLLLIALAQVVFGLGLGLIYYSSLYYSMNVGETKGEYGGFHEAAIGAGLFGGPAIGAAALHFFPNRPNAGAIAVSGLLLAGLAGLLIVRLRSRIGGV